MSIVADSRVEIPLMLGEVCLSRPDLRAPISKNPQSSWRLTRMMRRIGVDSVARPDAARLLGDLQLVCADCPPVPRCETGIAAGRSDDFHSFCPNADTFDTLQSQQPMTRGELIDLIVKLRWIGMEMEAERLSILVYGVRGSHTVLAVPLDTD